MFGVGKDQDESLHHMTATQVQREGDRVPGVLKVPGSHRLNLVSHPSRALIEENETKPKRKHDGTSAVMFSLA